MLIMKLPSPIRDHSERTSLLASFLVERLKDKDWFVKLGIEPQNIVDAVYYHDIGKTRIERDYHHSFYCTAPHRRKRYESHASEGIEAVKEELLDYLPAYERPSFEWCLWKAITEHHEELTGRGFPEAKDARSISVVGRITAIVDRFDNMLFVGSMGMFDFDSAVEELRCSIGALDKRLVNIFLSDIDALRDYTLDIYETEKNKPTPDTYGIKLEYRPRYKAGEKKIDSYRVKVRVNDAYYGMLKADILAPIGEQSGQIVRFEKLAFKKLCEDLDSLWTPDNDIPNVVFSVSAQQFKNKDFYRYVTETAESYEIDPSNICFALVEADMIRSAVDWNSVLDSYVSAGFSFIIDEMGDKFSMLPFLDELPIKCVCLKPYLLDKMGTNTKTKAYVIGLSKMLESMGIKAEFLNVRKQSETELLAAIGIDYFAGDLYGEPLTIGALRGDTESIDEEVDS
jgi:EAL domain-containing protein (putative c-di-GMP-specific phosphodiesterase class I)